MLCEICKQNQATIHIQELNKGKKTALHICENCAAKKGLNKIGLQGINIAEILYKLSASTEELLPVTDNSTIQPNLSNNNKTITNIICSKCKWDINKFRQTGRLGCENCYQTFSEILSETLSNMHKGTIHRGKRPYLKEPASELLMFDILNLQKQLDMHVIHEEYEKAAKLRDQINELKKEVNSGTNE
jgi:protein arginine kinase activator